MIYIRGIRINGCRSYLKLNNWILSSRNPPCAYTSSLTSTGEKSNRKIFQIPITLPLNSSSKIPAICLPFSPPNNTQSYSVELLLYSQIPHPYYWLREGLAIWLNLNMCKQFGILRLPNQLNANKVLKWMISMPKWSRVHKIQIFLTYYKN